MDGWDRVRWTEARQIAEQMDIAEADLPEAGVSPRAWFGALRARGDRLEAVRCLGLALPRLEAIAWAATLIEADARDRPLSPVDRRALDTALRWLGEPEDGFRREAMAAADTARDRSPERLLAMAVFFSGGSISLPDLAPVLPPPDAAGRMAAGAVVAAAHRHADPDAALDRALDLGDKLAAHGMDALKAA